MVVISGDAHRRKTRPSKKGLGFPLGFGSGVLEAGGVPFPSAVMTVIGP